MRHDGGNGSGNWGHGGAPGGGSVPGGGLAYRIVADDGSFTSEAKERLREKQRERMNRQAGGKSGPLSSEELRQIRAVTALMRDRYGNGRNDTAGTERNRTEVPGPKEAAKRNGPEVPARS